MLALLELTDVVTCVAQGWNIRTRSARNAVTPLEGADSDASAGTDFEDTNGLGAGTHPVNQQAPLQQ